MSPSLKFTIFHFSAVLFYVPVFYEKWTVNEIKQKKRINTVMLKQYAQVNTVIALLAFTGKTKGIC